MSDPTQPISILDARLAEIDRRLGAIQTGLVAEEPDLEAAAPEPGLAALGEPAAVPGAAAALPPRVTLSLADPAPAGPGWPRAADPAPAGPAWSRAADPAPAGSAPPRAADLIAELRELAGAHARLLDSMRELVAAYELAIAQADAPAPAPSAPAPSAPGPVRELSLSAGPLRSTEALRGFERTLSGIPEVRGVEVRGYEGGDRAIVDVHLIDPTS